ncbi:hypothetical protein TRFO_14836 [Tritrichomonas foetus]|uniref:Myb-like DNA-binding domain containing protein n=1 Tax=Tritrichomonas foetus TaxID=1144522 RepID=A0A1J4KYN0_9EUKA|nr:hypothetical protein TRFO_14836 [Tritrichomonas foetus]|eukprot:OHT14669.1 hypothetical protein TRFO_14836 [Tritrichomonas foetus]
MNQIFPARVRLLYPSRLAGPQSKKRKFTKTEDKILADLVSKHGCDWITISSHFTNRTARQCRERWTNYISTTLNHSPWTPQEDYILYSNYLMYGTHWRLFQEQLPDRSANAIKQRVKKIIGYWSENVKHPNLSELQSKINEKNSEMKRNLNIYNPNNQFSSITKIPKTMIPNIYPHLTSFSCNFNLDSNSLDHIIHEQIENSAPINNQLMNSKQNFRLHFGENLLLNQMQGPISSPLTITQPIPNQSIDNQQKNLRSNNFTFQNNQFNVNANYCATLINHNVFTQQRNNQPFIIPQLQQLELQQVEEEELQQQQKQELQRQKQELQQQQHELQQQQHELQQQQHELQQQQNELQQQQQEELQQQQSELNPQLEIQRQQLETQHIVNTNQIVNQIFEQHKQQIQLPIFDINNSNKQLLLNNSQQQQKPQLPQNHQKIHFASQSSLYQNKDPLTNSMFDIFANIEKECDKNEPIHEDTISHIDNLQSLLETDYSSHFHDDNKVF